MTDRTEFEQLQIDGANAYRLGKNEFANPFYRSDQMPAATGETLEEWQSKLAAWELGYKAEKAIDDPDGKMIQRIMDEIEK